MMFGSGMPILFPVAFISFSLIYILEKYMLYYVYRLPIKFDGVLYMSVLSVMEYASMIMLAMSFWFLSNK
jgi:hypothetical protein